jgi:hypothetical protein
MSDINDRLAALDPAANNPYQARNLDQMISRIVASSPSGAARSTWWQRVQVRIAAALILGTAIGAGTLAIVQGGPNLAALAIQANVKSHPGLFAPENTVQLQETKFAPTASLASSNISRLSASPSFELSIPKDSAAEAARLASAFHVVGKVQHHGNNWVVGSSAGAAFDYQTSSASPQWYYSSTTPKIAPSTASSSAHVAMPSHATLARDARGYLKRLGFNYSVVSPTYTESSVSTSDTDGAPSLQGQEQVTYTVAVQGVDTDQSVSFSVDAHNTVVYAQGPAFEVKSGTNYPLEGPLGGVNALNAMERAAFPRPALGASAAALTPLHVRLASVSISLATFRLKNGTTWLLPFYTYSGSLAKNSKAAARTWGEIAITPSYVRLSPSGARSLLNN